MKRLLTGLAGVALSLCGLLTLGCRPNNMDEQPRYENLERHDFFADGRVARPLPEGTVARDQPLPSSPFRSGRNPDGVFVTELAIELSAELVARGRSQYQTYCAICHGADGYGSGLVVRRGFPAPPSYHSERLREAPLGYFVHVIERGYGVMFPYASRVAPEDRWAIAAYIRALQLSQRADAESLEEADRKKLEESDP